MLEDFICEPQQFNFKSTESIFARRYGENLSSLEASLPFKSLFEAKLLAQTFQVETLAKKCYTYNYEKTPDSRDKSAFERL